MTPKQRFRCSDCAAEFSRKDHAKRHKLSHSRPRFVCAYPNCGLFFHRRDVLRRHEAVHRPENAEKRRRPRRGLLPPSRPGLEGRQEEVSPASETHHEVARTPVTLRGDTATESYSDAGEWTEISDDIVDATCTCHVQDGTVCLYCSSELIRLTAGRLPSDSQRAIMFCATHYIQSQLKWFPFIRPASLRTNWLMSGRALILAALGARSIKEYKALSGLLWTEAVSCQANWANSSVSDSKNLVSNFQTKILLLEYLQWSEGNGCPEWVRPMLSEMGQREACELVGMLSDFSAEFRVDDSVEDELCLQEIRWTLWKFYCILTRTTLLGLKLHPPSLFQALGLPGDPKRVLKLAACVGKESKELTESLRSEPRGSKLILPQALTMLLADQDSHIALADNLSMTDQYIMLHAILYLTDTMVDQPADIEKGQHQDPLGWRVETRERLYLLVRRWRQCFWIPPEVIFKTTSFPEFGIHQTIMLVIYIAVRIGQAAGDHSPHEGYSLRPYSQYAMRCVITMHIDMKHSGMMEVAAKGRWFLDGTTWRTGGLTAAYLMKWLRDRAKLGFEDEEDIEHIQSLEGVMALYSNTGSYEGLSYSPARVTQLERSMKHLWTMILGTESWLGDKTA
ncbi:hypothetical protein F5Y08DRAFT_321162 [Xylaria arbuscula]|nr:hypothetical protein F5Y08DRAFT_321162 [Xylaria arbuscula]